MEAVPRMPMVSFELKTSPEQTNFSSLKQYIAEYYQEDPASYSKECYQLEQLRGNAVRPTRDVDGTATVRRYYCQLHSIQNRFLLGAVSEGQQLLTFHWKDLYSGATLTKWNLKYEMAAVLHNFAALHTQLGAAEGRADPESMKKACTHFQCAAWAYGYVKDNYALLLQGDLSTELLIFMQALCLAQAQECIMEKSLCDNRKSGIIAKVTAQIVSYYNSALAALLTQSGDDGRVQDIVGSKQFKEWRRYVRFKISYLSCILLLYQGQQSEEQQKMGERVALYQASFDKLEEARKESKGLANIEQVNDALQFTMDVVEAKRKAAKNENEFIYHEEVPDLSAITAVQGANLVNGIAFNVTDPEAMGEDIFHRLVPMKAHESSSMYSEEKATLLRTIGTKLDDKEVELQTFIDSLNLDAIEAPRTADDKRLPQGLVDRCAELQAKPNAISDLVQSMSTLADTCSDVELTLKEIKNLLRQDEIREEQYQAKIGQRSNGGAHMVELGRELAKYQEAHNKAGESNDTLRKAMGLHVHNLKILSQPLPDIKAQIPVCTEQFDEAVFQELNTIVQKVKEMKVQRIKLYQELRQNITDDDITSQLIALEGGGSEQKQKMDELFRKELGKHDQLVGFLEQNMKAQGNILKALTEVYAKCAPALKSLSDVKTKRDQFFSSLSASFDVYEDLLSKSAKGLEFYRKLQSNVQKLYSRVKAACDVQEEERNQKLKSSNVLKRSSIDSGAVGTIGGGAGGISSTGSGGGSGGPKLKDYLKAGTISLGSIKAAGVDKNPATHLPSVRPAPVGSESNAPVVGMAGGGTGGYYQDSYTNYHQQYHQQQQQQQQMQCGGNSNMSVGGTGYDYSQYSTQHQSQPQPSATGSTVATGYVNPMYQNQTSTNYYYNNNQAQVPQSSNTTGYDYGQYGQQQVPPPAQQPSPAPSTSSASSDVTQQQASWGQLNQQFSAMNLQQPTADGSYANQTAGTSSNQGYSQVAVYQSSVGVNQQQQQQQQQYPTVSQPNAYPTPYPTSSNESMTSVSSSQDVAAAAYGNYGQQQQPYQQPAPQQPYGAGSSTTPYYQQAPYQTEQTASYGSHPGYSYNPQTGAYDYTSGFQYDSNNATAGSYANQYVSNPQLGSSSMATTYTASGQTAAPASVDSSASQPYQLSTGGTPAPSAYPQGQPANATSSYYNTTSGAATSAGYYHQTSTYSTVQSNQYLASQPDPATVVQQSPLPPAAHSTPNDPTANVAHYSHHTNSYVDSTGSQNTTTTTASSSSSSTTQQQSVVSPQTTQSKNIDLLSGIDFSPALVPPIAAPILQPQPTAGSIVGNAAVDGSEAAASVILTPTKATVVEKPVVEKAVVPDPAQTVQTAVPAASSSVIGERKPSLDNLSLCSDLSSSFDWESASVCGATASVSGAAANPADNVFLRPTKPDPFEDGATLKWFHKEVERLEKFVETSGVKTLNGTTPLDSKWKELQDLLVKEEAKRQVSVARLFPEKNRSIDCVPYDHARVQLSTDTDNYINAVYVKDLGFGCPHFILAQAPLPNTVNDFWNMIWSQKSNVIVCLHTANELLDPFWPTEVGKELSYGDVSVTLMKQFDLTHCTERTLRISMLGSDYSLTVALLQPKLWPKNSPEQILGVAQNLIDSYRQYNQEQKLPPQLRPLVLNCLNGTDRSSLVTVAIVTILATQTRKPLLINVIDIWYRICCQRKGALRDPNLIQLSYQIVLNNGHGILNKRGILTSYQMKSAQVASSTVKEEANNDPFKDLDPLWKLK